MKPYGGIGFGLLQNIFVVIDVVGFDCVDVVGGFLKQLLHACILVQRIEHIFRGGLELINVLNGVIVLILASLISRECDGFGELQSVGFVLPAGTPRRLAHLGAPWSAARWYLLLRKIPFIGKES